MKILKNPTQKTTINIDICDGNQSIGNHDLVIERRNSYAWVTGTMENLLAFLLDEEVYGMGRSDVEDVFPELFKRGEKSQILTVKDYIAALEKMDPELEIASLGHFGEKLEVDLPYHCKESNLAVIETETKGDIPH